MSKGRGEKQNLAGMGRKERLRITEREKKGRLDDYLRFI